MALPLTLACGEYDRTYALRDGRAPVEGVDLNYVVLEIRELMLRQARFAEFQAAEFSLSTHMLLHARGDRRFVGIPVFPSRHFRHQNIWINSEAGIAQPSDLRGRRIGVMEYQQTGGVWVRGFLQHDYGVDADAADWYLGPLNRPQPGWQEGVGIKVAPHIRRHVIPEGKCLDGMLEAGELDALISTIAPASFVRRSPRVARLFPDYPAVEAEYYRHTGIFPIMHLVVLRREVYERDRWVARALQKAFTRAKQLAIQRLTSSHEGPVYAALPWLHHHTQETLRLMGDDYWPYGVPRNRAVLALAAQYAHEQGLLEQPIQIDELFAPETLPELDLGPDVAGARYDL